MTGPASLSRPRPPSHPPSTSYLLLYNLISSLLWLTILGRLLLLLILTHDPTHTYAALGHFTRNVQSLALLEILHAATGLVRANVGTTAMQVASRLLVVWAVVEGFKAGGDGTGKGGLESSIAYSTMLFAWSTTEVVRYTYFVCQLHADIAPPELIKLARYNLFWVMYPLGIGSECWLVWRASQVAGQGQGLLGLEGQVWQWGFWAVLAVYVPGSWVLFGHMVGQRRRVLRGKGKEK